MYVECPSARRGRVRRGRRCSHLRQTGQGMVEFAIVGPIAFLLLLGIIIVGIAAANQDLLTNGVRDTARAAAVCGGSASRTGQSPVTQLPAAGSVPVQTCSWANLDTYAKTRLPQLIGGSSVTPTTSLNTNCATLANAALACLFNASDIGVSVSGSNPLDLCQRGYKIEISTQYAQPLFVPIVSNLFGSNGTSSRTLSADAEATCEQ